jgi:hypothetical protein
LYGTSCNGFSHNFGGCSVFLNNHKDGRIKLDWLAQFLRLAAMVVAQSLSPFLLALNADLIRARPSPSG